MSHAAVHGKARVHPKWPIGAPRGTYQMAYGMVGHLMNNVGVHPKRPIGALRGIYQVAYAVVIQNTIWRKSICGIYNDLKVFVLERNQGGGRPFE